VPESPVHELRLALTVERYDEAVAFYRDLLGLPVIESFEGPGGGGIVLDAGRATLELLSVGQAELVDEVEVGSRVAGSVRVALEVADSAAVAGRLVAGGAEALAEPVVTPGATATSGCAPPTGCSSPCSPSWRTPIDDATGEPDRPHQVVGVYFQDCSSRT